MGARRGRGFDLGGTLFSAGRSVLTLAFAFAIALTLTAGLALPVRWLLSVTVLHLAITVVRAPGAVAVAAIVVTLTTVVLAGRGIASTTGRNATAAGRAITATARSGAFPGGAGVEAPRCGRRSTGPLDLEEVITADTLVVHLMVCVIRITTALILHESKESAGRRARGRDVATNKPAISLEFVGEVPGAGAVAEASDVEGGATAARHGVGDDGEWAGLLVVEVRAGG